MPALLGADDPWAAMVVAAAPARYAVRAIDSSTGKPTWSTQLEGRRGAALHKVGIVGGTDELVFAQAGCTSVGENARPDESVTVALHRTTGKEVWRVQDFAAAMVVEGLVLGRGEKGPQVRAAVTGEVVTIAGLPSDADLRWYGRPSDGVTSLSSHSGVNDRAVVVDLREKSVVMSGLPSATTRTAILGRDGDERVLLVSGDEHQRWASLATGETEPVDFGATRRPQFIRAGVVWAGEGMTSPLRPYNRRGEQLGWASLLPWVVTVKGDLVVSSDLHEDVEVARLR